MQKLTLDSHFEKYESFEELTAQDRLLVEEAKKAADDAYAPYSRFHVGAAVMLENGVIVRGVIRKMLPTPPDSALSVWLCLQQEHNIPELKSSPSPLLPIPKEKSFLSFQLALVEIAGR